MDYDILMQPIHEGLDVFRVAEDKKLSDHPWFNRTLCRVNDSLVRLGVFDGAFHWHTHEAEDEFFYCIEGKLLVDLEDRTVELAPRQGFTVPKGVSHRTRAPERTVMLMFEGSCVTPTGDPQDKGGQR